MHTKKALVVCVRSVKRVGVLNLGNHFHIYSVLPDNFLFSRGFPPDSFYVRLPRS